MLGIDIYEFILSKGFKLSYSRVCKYIKEVQNKVNPSSKEAFIRGYHPPGDSCEFSWGEVKLYIGGKLHRFCNPRAGWEKGHVERSVEYLRRKAFSALLRFYNLEDAQKQLSSTCKRINTEEGSISTVGKQSKLEVELSALRAYHNEIGCFKLETYKVDKWSTICLKASH